ncbi:hypothetical protein [Glaciibacter superstes]|uniref:primosomal protein N' family DNA-binding protein n=1 Tax=Glaciibacter superstes TaxID=501023 RepID=UPI0003B2FEF5|nr:hypothetical protein [Glaciibacter superstes]
MTGTGRIARVLIDSPLPQLDHLFDYRIPDELSGTARPGVRVTVPFRQAGRTAAGYLVEVVAADENSADESTAGEQGASAGSTDAPFRGTLSPLESVVSAVPVLSPGVWQLARRVADRAAGTASDVLRLAIPPRQVRVEKAWLAAAEAQTPEAQTTEVRTPEAQTSVPQFTDYEPGTLARALDGHRLAVAAVPKLVPLADGKTIGAWARTMAELAAATVATGRTAIVVVPDYRDQDQVQAALDALVPAETVSRVDARQSNPDRYRAFLACLAGQPRIVLGNRSAVYAPAENLGLIALWDDGDPLHAEPLSPYVHARDAALVRQEQTGCGLVLLGQSRSVEAQRLVELGWLSDVRPERAVHPKVIPTEMQNPADEYARIARIPTAAWQAAKAALENGPVLVQVASPGYAPVLACQSCKHSARCTRCQGPLGLASRGAMPSCRWCGALAADWTCAHCEGRTYRLVTVGAGRTAEELGRGFPGVRVLIADGDHPVQQIGSEPALVIATRGAEPIPAGGYRAILLLDGERMLARESLRVGEDCLRWWANAAALAAPGAPVVLVGVGGGLARALNSWRPDAYAARELADRQTLRFPPAVRIASVTGAESDVQAALGDLAQGPSVDVLGPVTSEPGMVRAIVRFAYSEGDAVAASLKAAVVRNASRRRRPKGGAGRAAPTLRIRFDDPELL